MVNQFLQSHNIPNSSIDAIASHGQTIYHAPKRLHQLPHFGNGTLQIGDADHIATTTGIITLSDFRQKHIARGGEGAPLAVYGDYLLFSHQTENRIMLNIGGIANFTFLPSHNQGGNIICTDTGAGNTLMDAFTQTHFPPNTYDADAALAKQGAVNPSLLNTLLQHPFFHQSFPKSTGQETFNLSFLNQALDQANLPNLSPYDTLATLNFFTAHTITQAINTAIPSTNSLTIYVSGGGIHNPLLMQNLHALLPQAVFNPIHQLGIPPDAKEAILFAILANETLAAQSFSHYQEVGLLSVSLGKVSFPS